MNSPGMQAIGLCLEDISKKSDLAQIKSINLTTTENINNDTKKPQKIKNVKK